MKCNLFCFHFAGGSRYSYNNFIEQAPEYIQVIPIELPGRGSRITEELLTDIDSMADDVFSQIRHRLQAPYAIYGHSLGSLLAYLVMMRITRNGLNKPAHLFVSGRGGPSVINEEKLISQLPREQFVKSLEEMGGFPDELLYDNNVIDFFEPILRSDFKGVEQYRYEKPFIMDIPITAMIGDEEETTYEEACEWKKETIAHVDIKVFPGKHFFIFDHAKGIMDVITAALRP